MYGSIIRTENKYFLCCCDDGAISASDSADEIIQRYEDTYERKHKQNFEGSMSACLNYIYFQVSVIELPEDIQDIKNWISEFKIQSVRNISGGFTGIPLKLKIGKKLWDEGIKPKLIRL